MNDGTEDLAIALAGAVVAIVIIGVLFFTVWQSGAVGDMTGDDLGNLERVVDEEAGVVCWVRVPTGVDCLPLNQTQLTPPKREGEGLCNQ